MPVTICPIALVSSCVKCPIFKACPVKGLIGDYRPGKDGGKQDDKPAAKHAPKHASPADRGKPKRRNGRNGKRGRR